MAPLVCLYAVEVPATSAALEPWSSTTTHALMLSVEPFAKAYSTNCFAYQAQARE